MKKILLAILIVFVSFISINSVYADMSAPEMREFEVIVTNSDGVDYYDYKGNVSGHLNKGEKVFVIYEYDGKYTLGIKTNKYGFESNESIGSVNSLKDFALVETEVDPELKPDDGKITKYNEPQKAIVYASEGVDIFKGPSDVYEKIGHINKDTQLTYQYAIRDIDITYIYVTYGDVKGWVNILKGKVLIQNDTQYVFRNDVDTKCGIIPKNSVTTPTYRTDAWKHETLFEYNNCKVLIRSFRDSEILDIYAYQQIVNKDITLYKDANSSSEVIGTIPSGSEVTVLAGGDFMAETENVRYIKYNDLVGWSLDSDDTFDSTSNGNPEENKEPIIDDTIKIEDIEIPENNVEKPKQRLGLGLNLFIILCACGVGLLVITAVVVIILVNKLGKKNVNEDKK